LAFQQLPGDDNWLADRMLDFFNWKVPVYGMFSMPRPGHCGFEQSLYQADVIHRYGAWRSLEALECATLAWVAWFHCRRLLQPIGNIPPALSRGAPPCHDQRRRHRHMTQTKSPPASPARFSVAANPQRMS
jgi:transposase InsO family protein